MGIVSDIKLIRTEGFSDHVHFKISEGPSLYKQMTAYGNIKIGATHNHAPTECRISLEFGRLWGSSGIGVVTIIGLCPAPQPTVSRPTTFQLPVDGRATPPSRLVRADRCNKTKHFSVLPIKLIRTDTTL